MTRNDTIILVTASLILLIGVFVGFSRVTNEPVARNTPSENNSSLGLNPDDSTTARINPNTVNSENVIGLNQVPETGKRSYAKDKDYSYGNDMNVEATVSLTQVPYTGVSSNAKVYLFLLAMAVWTGGISFFLVRRKALAEIQ